MDFLGREPEIEEKSNELCNFEETLHKFHVPDVQKPTSNCNSPSDDSYRQIEDDFIGGEPEIEENSNGVEYEIDEAESLTQKCLCKCKTFPPTGKLSLTCSESSDEDEEEFGVEHPINHCIACTNSSYVRSRSMPLPTAVGLVSALKGSREKQGTPPKKLTVSWSPDVYDPPPTSLSHVVKSKGQKRSKNKDNYNNRKNGKNKQKGKSARVGGGSKDKKQFRKIAGSSDKCFKSPNARDRVVFDDDFDDPSHNLDHDVGGPDSNCGSSFLKKSLAKIHVSVAEAL